MKLEQVAKALAAFEVENDRLDPNRAPQQRRIDAMAKALETLLAASQEPAPVAWQYRWHEANWIPGSWSEWAFMTKDPTGSIRQHDYEVRPLYAAPVPPVVGEDALRTAAAVLVAKLDGIHADPDYRRVWEIAQLHGGQYTGPNYINELASLRAALASREAGQ
jgi:hypothetical protein